MIETGIFTGCYRGTVDETLAGLRRDGFSHVQLDVAFHDRDALRDGLAPTQARELGAKFRDAGLTVAAVSGYTNPLHPDPARRARNLAFLRLMMERARDLGCPYVASETGTLNADSDWCWHDGNATAAAFRDAVNTIRELATFAGEVGAVFVIEGYANNVIGTIESAQRLLAEINSPHLKLLCDPTNYFTRDNIHDPDAFLRRFFDAFSGQLAVAHAKDARLQPDVPADAPVRGAEGVELPAPGLGVMNYALYVSLLEKHHPDSSLIIEHLAEDDIPRAKRFVDAALGAV